MLLVLLFVVVLLLPAGAQAEMTDSCVAYVTPGFTYSVLIDTQGAGINFGSMQAGEVKISTAMLYAQGPSTVTVTNNGNGTADWQISAAKPAGCVWDLLPRPAKTDMVVMDTGTLTAILTPPTTALADISDISFNFEDMIDTSGQWYDMNGSSFTALKNSDNDVPDDGNNVAVGNIRNMYFRFHSPSDSSVSTQQSYLIKIRASAGNTF